MMTCVTPKGDNEPGQLASYSASSRSKLGQSSARVSSTRARVRLETLTIRAEPTQTRFEKLVNRLGIIIYI
ncbi:hypothetical protein GQ457_16G008310 [Hibiscus cannabinus]